MAAVVKVESTYNPFAIGVVGTRLARQPRNQAEAIATAQALAAAGYNFSLGMGQVNRHNLTKNGLDYARAFEPCANLKAASRILQDCFGRAKASGLPDQAALQAALSCYYSGNFSTGLRSPASGQPSYVERVLQSTPMRTGTQAPRAVRLPPPTPSNAVISAAHTAGTVGDTNPVLVYH